MRPDDDAAQLDADDESLVARLRALPSEGAEPDWAVLERSIRDAVGPSVPRPWWRRWRWIVPIGALAATAAALLLWLRHPASEPAPLTPETATPTMAFWLDGQIIEVDESAPVALPDASDELATEGSGDGFLPADDLGWIDSLDDKALDRADAWLAKEKT